MAKSKKAAEAEAPVETSEADPTPKVTQREAVKQALAAGAELPADGVPYVSEKFGITLTNQAFSTLKSLIRKEEGIGKPAPKGPKAPKTNGKAQASGVVTGNGSPAALAMAVKQLVEQHGAEAVREVTRVFEG